MADVTAEADAPKFVMVAVNDKFRTWDSNFYMFPVPVSTISAEDHVWLSAAVPKLSTELSPKLNNWLWTNRYKVRVHSNAITEDEYDSSALRYVQLQ